MRRFVSGRLLILVFLLLPIEIFFSSYLFSLRVRVGLLELLVLDYAFSRNMEKAPLFSLFVGFFRDFTGAHLFGIETVSFAASGFLLYLALLKLDRESDLIRYGLAALFVLLTESLSFGLGVSLELAGRGSTEFWGHIFGTTLYTMTLAPLFFWFTNRWFKRTTAFKQYELFS